MADAKSYKSAKKIAQQGFTLIELMIVVAIIGILMVIALPAYQDYVVRSKLTEAMVTAGAAKTAITEYYISQGNFPSNLTQAGVTSSPASNVVTNISWVAASNALRIDVSSGVGGDVTASANTFQLVATGSGGGVQWACSSVDIDAKYLPSNCR